MVAWLMEQLLEWLSERVLDVLEFVMGVLAATVFVVPNVAALPQVRGIWSQNLIIVNTAYVLAIIAAGIVAMTHETVQVRYSVKDLLPRVVLGAVAANFSLTWCGTLLELGDALTHAVAGQPLADTGSLDVIKNQLVAALVDPQVALLTLLVAGVATVLLFLLIFQWIIRFGVLLVLAVAGPFALAAYCLPQLDSAAGLWWRTLPGTLGTHLLQALTLYTGLAVFLAPGSGRSLLSALADAYPVVVLDAGRWTGGSPADELLSACQVVLLVTSSELEQIRQCQARIGALRSLVGEVRLLLVQVRGGWPAGEVGQVLGLPVAGALPVDGRGAGVLSGRLVPRNGWRAHGPGSWVRLPLLRACHSLARALASESPGTASEQATPPPAWAAGSPGDKTPADGSMPTQGSGRPAPPAGEAATPEVSSGRGARP
jgi:hypothetical protein